MNADVATSFLTYYIRSLAERTRVEKASTKFGFDWIIYNLALADGLTPYRLPFFRSGPNEISKTKTEPEFGVDSSFLSQDRETLNIFVLKDEVLSNSTWTANDFDADLRRAAAPDLTPPEFADVRRVKVILAYNKDEDQTGIHLYTNLANNLCGRISGDVNLTFERWNLTTLTEKVQKNLLTPSLLPQKFFSLFSYICSQFGDFRHASDEWTNQLVPNWRRFLDDLLQGSTDERSVRLVPVALIILREYGRSNTSSETGWIDLAEWAMLAVWRVYQKTPKRAVRHAVLEMWTGFYLAELYRFYQSHSSDLAVEHSLERRSAGSYIDAVATAVVAYWHIGRIGILSANFAELARSADLERGRAYARISAEIADWLVGFLNANPSTKRPLVDLHHIELFLIWRTLYQTGRVGDVARWLSDLRSHLFVRRLGLVPLPFIEGRSSLELVFEHAATGDRPPEFCDQSSLLLLCILEFCFSLDASKRDELLELFYREIVLGRDSRGESLKGLKPIDLMGWSPPEDWGDKVLVKTLANEGESQTMELFDVPGEDKGGVIAKRIGKFVQLCRAARMTSFPDDLPLAVVVLGCLKHQSPLPAEVWRASIFGPLEPADPSSVR